jgi:hypothetical protein
MSTSRDRPTSGVSPLLHGGGESGAAGAGAQHLERVRRRTPLHHDLAQVERLEEAADGGLGGLAHYHTARPGSLLKARGQVGGISNRRVVHPQVVPDLPHDDGPRVETDPHLQREPALGLHLPVVISECPLDGERGVSRAPRAVLVSDGRAKERHHAVAGVLVDRALEPVDLGRDQLEASVNDAVHVLGVQLLGESGEARDVGEEDGNLTALALEGGPRPEDLVGEMPRGVGDHRTPVRERGGRRGTRRPCLGLCPPLGRRSLTDALAAGSAESGLGPDRPSAARAHRVEDRPALIAEAVLRWVVHATCPAHHAVCVSRVERTAELRPTREGEPRANVVLNRRRLFPDVETDHLMAQRVIRAPSRCGFGVVVGSGVDWGRLSGCVAVDHVDLDPHARLHL